jgi:hypothetical protein
MRVYQDRVGINALTEQAKTNKEMVVSSNF